MQPSISKPFIYKKDHLNHTQESCICDAGLAQYIELCQICSLTRMSSMMSKIMSSPPQVKFTDCGYAANHAHYQICISCPRKGWYSFLSMWNSLCCCVLLILSLMHFHSYQTWKSLHHNCLHHYKSFWYSFRSLHLIFFQSEWNW